MTQQVRPLQLDEYEVEYDEGMCKIYVDCKRCEFYAGETSPVTLQALLQLAADHEFSTHMK